MDIEVKNLRKNFGQTAVLNGLNFRVASGEILGFLGPNGAGKTTTMRVLTGFLAPTSGQVLVDGRDLLDQSVDVRQKIGYLPENNPLYPELRVFEYLRFSAAAKQVAQPDQEIRKVVAGCGLRDRVGQGIGTLSKGLRQRVGLAAALLGNPELVVLDEPTSGLDPNQIVEIRHLIRDIGKTRTVILSTHILQEVQASCTRVLIINRGQIVGQGTTAELTTQAAGRRRVEAIIAGPEDAVCAALQQLPGVASLEQQVAPAAGETAVALEAEKTRDVRRDIFELCVERHWPLLELKVSAVSLEDVFHRLTTEQPQSVTATTATPVTVPAIPHS
ncbi:MAG: ATP-binding cassette domain-containing protein [bacterium]|nr:ATP-binding cassette domain-containing protein [bacterium]